MPIKLNTASGGGVILQGANTASDKTITIPADDGTMVYANSSGNVGIGTSSPNAFNASANRLVIGSGTGNNGATIYAGSASQAGIYFADGVAGSEPYSGQFIYNHADNSFLTYVNGTTLATKIDSLGRFVVGTTGAPGWLGRISAESDSSGAAYPLAVNNTAAGTGSSICIDIYRSATRTGSISNTNTTTTYSTSSDYRLKENVRPMAGALAKIEALKPVTYTWKTDGSAGEGFIAHELAEVVPQCVSGDKDAVDAEGNPVYQGIDTSFLVATLTAAIQELKAEVDQLRAQVEAK